MAAAGMTLPVEVEMSVATVRPGDIVIVRYSRVLSAEWVDKIKGQLKERLPGIRDVVVIEADELAIYRPDQVDGDGEHTG